MGAGADRPAPPPQEAPCPCCGGRRFVPQYRIGRHTLIRCRACSLIRLAEPPTPEALAAIYSTDRYFQNPDFLSGAPETLYGYQDAAAESELKALLYGRLLGPVLRWAFPAPAGLSWLDVGAGLGSLVAFARREGFDALGIEANPTAVAKARAAVGEHFLHGWIETVRLDRAFDVVTLMDVIEHVLDPEACLRWVGRHLAAGGIAVVVTMDSRSLVSRILGSRLEDFRRVSEHIHFFARSNFRLLAERAGLRVEAVRSWGGYFHGRRLFQRAGAMCGLPAPAAERLAAALVPPRLTLYLDPHVKMMVVLRRGGDEKDRA